MMDDLDIGMGLPANEGNPTRSPLSIEALDAWQNGDLISAEMLYMRALQLPCEEAEMLDFKLMCQLAGVIASAGRHDEAQVKYQGALAGAMIDGTKQDQDVARYFLAEHLLALDRFDEVLAVIGEISAGFAPPAICTLRAIALSEIGLPGAEEAAREAVAKAGDDVQRERVIAMLGKYSL